MVIDVGFGYIMKPDSYRSAEERLQHDIERQRNERRLCEMYGLNYDEVLHKRGEKCLLQPEAV